MITLVLGGTRSGKSEHAEQLARATAGPVTYVATAHVGDDADLAARVERHRSRRPRDWTTIDAGAQLVSVLRSVRGLVLLDSLGTWVAVHDDFAAPLGEVGELVEALTGRDGDTIVVSEEVGLSVHPPTELGRRFVDALGELNRSVAGVADVVVLVVAGRALVLP